MGRRNAMVGHMGDLWRDRMLQQDTQWPMERLNVMVGHMVDL